MTFVIAWSWPVHTSTQIDFFGVELLLSHETEYIFSRSPEDINITFTPFRVGSRANIYLSQPYISHKKLFVDIEGGLDHAPMSFLVDPDEDSKRQKGRWKHMWLFVEK